MKSKIRLLLLLLLMLPVMGYAQQQFGGIGAQLFLDTMGGHSMPQIQGFVPHSAADQYLKATDYIIKVDGNSCLDKPLQDVVAMIRGEVGSTVKITVADTKEGKRPREYDLVRGSITSAAPPPAAPPADPAAAFNNECASEVAKLKKEGFTIVKTFPSDCGDYFFNFNADAQSYHIRILGAQDNETDVSSPFSLSAGVFDNADEKNASELLRYNIQDAGVSGRFVLYGVVPFSKPCVATIHIVPHNDVKKCRAVYIVVYK